MKVIKSEQKTDVYIGDIIKFEGLACMVIDMGSDSDFYGLLVLEGYNAGTVVAKFEGLVEIDNDSRTTELIMKKAEVVICKGEEECPF